ncbi:MAG: hypothetical protein BGO98_14060 [Myxococcales bacterium 68-20]|nr:RNA polymerase sigma factor [Myxococcales bacterium]OJY21094.1 MAG: hypothetical protein BGO98_14060 [Myxococcales bacterium 68-20]
MAALSPALAEAEYSAEEMSSRQDQATRLREAATAYFANVWRFLRSLGVPASSLDDAAQEVFLVAANRLAEVRPGAERSFLFGTAVHVARTIRRKHTREQLLDDPDDATLEPASTSTPEESFDQKEEHDLLMKLLDGLPEELRTTFVLYEIEGESLPSVAATLGIPLGTATSRLRRAREKFAVGRQRLHLQMRGEK